MYRLIMQHISVGIFPFTAFSTLNPIKWSRNFIPCSRWLWRDIKWKNPQIHLQVSTISLQYPHCRFHPHCS